MLYLITRVEPIQLRHRNIEDDHIRFEFGRHLNQSPSVIRNADNVEFGLEKTFASFGQQGVVIGNQ
jgi:hypothetical protein